MIAALALIAIAWGLIGSLIFRRFTRHEALRIVRKRIHAHLLGIRLYADEPAAVWNAQKAILVDNLRFLALIAKPVLILAVPFAFLYGPLDAIYAWTPLEVGMPATVTLQSDAPYALTVPFGIAIETLPIHVAAEHRIVWRIRALKPTLGVLTFSQNGNSISRSIAAGDRTFTPHYRTESGIEVDYPKAQDHWLAWFFAISALTAAVAHFALPPPSC